MDAKEGDLTEYDEEEKDKKDKKEDNTSVVDMDTLKSTGANLDSMTELIESRSLFQLSRNGYSDAVGEVIQFLKPSQINALDEKRCSALHYAARYSQVDTVSILLENNANVDRIGSDDMTPLHYAARYGKNSLDSAKSANANRKLSQVMPDLQPRIAVIALLLRSKADINRNDAFGMTALHHAAMRGYADAVQFLASQPGVDLDLKDIQGSTPLHLAANYGHAVVVEVLLEMGAKESLLCNQKQNVFHRTAANGNLEVMNTLFSKVEKDQLRSMLANRDSNQCTPFFLSVESGETSLVELLLSNGSTDFVNAPGKEGEYPLHCAARSGVWDTVQLLINNGSEINKMNRLHQTPLFLAAKNDDEEIVSNLIKLNAALNESDGHGCTPLMTATEYGYLEIAKLLMDAGADLEAIDKDDKNVLHIAAENGHHKLLEVLIQHCSPEMVNHNDQYDNTALHLAALEGHFDCASILIDNGADIDNQNEDEKTPCHLAATNGHLTVLRLILEKDECSVFDKDEDDNSPLHLAAVNNQPKAVDLLLSNGASVQDRNSNAWTALDCAASKGALECVRLLLGYGSPVDPLDKKNSTPLHLAAESGHSLTVKLLLEEGADIRIVNIYGENALETAIRKKQREVAETILRSNNWRQALRSTCVTTNDHGDTVPNTPLRMLIRTFPDLAEHVFDKCIEFDEKKKIMHLDFEFLDDTFNLELHSNSDNEKVYEMCHVDDENNLGQYDKPYDLNGMVRMGNHPLTIMSDCKQKHLLKHPLCTALVRYKWKKFGRIIYYLQLILYMLYLSSITGYILVKVNSAERTNTSALIVDDAPQNKTIAQEVVLQWMVIVLSIIGIVLEIQQGIRMRKRYFNVSNIVDWVVYLLSLLLVTNLPINVDFSECTGNKCWQWPVGSFVVTLAWLNLLTFIRQLQMFGIYVIMFFEICKSVLRFAMVGTVFLIGFSLGFYIIIYGNDVFDSFGWSILKTVVMMTGEFEYGDIFKNEEQKLPFPGFTTFLFVVFIFVMTIILMNLLVGLAVDDIKEVQDQAELQKLSSQVSHILELERFLLNIWPKTRFKQKVILQLRDSSGWSVRDVISKDSIWTAYSDRHRDNTSTIQVSEEEKLLRSVMAQMKEIQEDLINIKAKL